MTRASRWRRRRSKAPPFIGGEESSAGMNPNGGEIRNAKEKAFFADK
jgi:hypothetical protein